MKSNKSNISETPEEEMSASDFFDNEEKKLKTHKKFLDKEKIKINQTSSQKKMWNYINDLTKNSFLRKDIINFRKKFNIKENGYTKLIYTKASINSHKVLTYPNYKEIKGHKEYRSDLTALSKKYKTGFFWEDILECYIFYNRFIDIETKSSMIEVEDVSAHFSGDFGLFKNKDWYVMRGGLKEKSEQFPIAIFLNPYVSQRDIIDYIKKTFKLSIEPKLKWYRDNKIKLGTVRRKNDRVKQRNKFIYENRNIKIEALVHLVNEKFGEIMDYTYVARIIKEGKRLRK